MPLDLTRLLIKRKSKESFDFIIHYHMPEYYGDVSSQQISDLYNLLSPKDAHHHNVGGKRGSLPTSEVPPISPSESSPLIGGMDTLNLSSGTQTLNKDRRVQQSKQSPFISRRGTVKVAIPNEKRLLSEKENIVHISEKDSYDDESMKDEEDDELLIEINGKNRTKRDVSSQRMIINYSKT